ncbi:FAD-dependent oxidoreductase, partial [Bacillus cereus]
GRLLRNALISAAKKHGATFIKGDAILVREGNHITGVTVNDETILAEKVIVTAGAWANEILKPLGINFLVTFQKG